MGKKKKEQTNGGNSDVNEQQRNTEMEEKQRQEEDEEESQETKPGRGRLRERANLAFSLFSSRWEDRHGATVALREILRYQAEVRTFL